ncbi:hypothetical protein [Flavobacterium sp. H122]|uniref:hypothetical protein n=1 Tax=Flavobacterium sp. H122 TaxID=2529860 RepID=UPI0010AABF61|nr:hypothetical protein [Flavobacterium sp. H122]
MNPMNLMFSFFFAKSSAEKYNVADTQKLQNMALMSGMVSSNPVLSYLIIENEAKNLGTTAITGGSTSTPTPPAGTLTCKYDASALEKKIEGIVVKAIKENVSVNCQTEKDTEIIRLTEEINNDVFPIYIEKQIENLASVKSDFQIILNSKVLNQLKEEDVKTFEYLEKLIETEKLLDNCIDLLNKSKSISQLNTYLLVNVVLGIESKVSYLKHELERIERELVSTTETPAVTTPESLIETDPKTITKTTPKK